MTTALDGPRSFNYLGRLLWISCDAFSFRARAKPCEELRLWINESAR